MQNLQQPQQGSRLAAGLNARLADGSIALPIAVSWWREEWREAARNGEKISTSEMNDAEMAAFGIGFFEELRGISEAHGVPGAATSYEAELQGCWEDLEKARSKALCN
jgi:hypothetical protein